MGWRMVHLEHLVKFIGLCLNGKRFDLQAHRSIIYGVQAFISVNWRLCSWGFSSQRFKELSPMAAMYK